MAKGVAACMIPMPQEAEAPAWLKASAGASRNLRSAQCTLG